VGIALVHDQRQDFTHRSSRFSFGENLMILDGRTDGDRWRTVLEGFADEVGDDLSLVRGDLRRRVGRRHYQRRHRMVPRQINRADSREW
jgi:hypothetical protein